MEFMTIFLIALVVLAVVFVKMAVVIIPQSETKIIERLGKYYATLSPGVTLSYLSLTVQRPSLSVCVDAMAIQPLSTFASRCTTLISRT